ncbi:MAG: hypothetical protein AUJ34_00120 [Parcubacteria group bacterium CG1_02_41_12]|nr:MAG: hypothetical protein AUJ34_00120 [Parcubacteria group bacterium CG1_02_41_12]
MQNKNTNTSKKKSSKYSVGVFILVIILFWFASFKLFGSGPGGAPLFGNDDNDSEKPVFTELFASDVDYPVMVVFDNHPDSRAYLSGISSADVVYEYLAEGGATRFAGLYSGAPDSIEKIGPVRSARPYVVETASGWSAFFMHAGGSPEALNLIKSGRTDVTDLNEISGLGEIYFWRDNNIARPHNLFTSADRIDKARQYFELNELPYEKLIWQWEDDDHSVRVSQNARVANSVYVDFSEGLLFDAQYEYDSETGKYMRSMSGLVHEDVLSGQLSATNIIIQKVPEEGYYPSGEGRISLDMIGQGDIMLFQNGKMTQGTWKKESRDSQTKWFDLDGEPIVLAHGQTWVEIVPGSRVVSFE